MSRKLLAQLAKALALTTALSLAACSSDDGDEGATDTSSSSSTATETATGESTDEATESTEEATDDSTESTDEATESTEASTDESTESTDEVSDESTDDTLPPPTRVEIGTLTNKSAAEYGHNRFGLIEADTLEAYATSWGTKDTAAEDGVPNGRPAYLADDARLVVLQLNKAARAAGEDFVPSSVATGVYVYELDTFRFNETRDTGLISETVRYQASGATTDDWLTKYGIDLKRDFVVFAAGANSTTTGGFFQDLARAIYWLSYWGADLKHLAIVNGTLAQNYTGTLESTALAEGTFSADAASVRTLRNDQTGLTLPLEDFLEVVDNGLAAEDVVTGFKKQFIIDARPTAQFLRTATNAAFGDTHPGQFITTAWNSSGAPSPDATGQAKSYVPYEGHVKGAVSFPWANLVEDVGGNNWKYKSLTDLETLFTTAGYTPDKAADTVIVSQCRTNFEVQVNGFAARVVLGYPTVHFDGSLVEYFSLVSNHPTAEFNLTASDAAYKYRTDVATRSQFYAAGSNAEAPTTTEDDAGVAAYNVPTDVAPARLVAQAKVNRQATTTGPDIMNEKPVLLRKKTSGQIPAPCLKAPGKQQQSQRKPHWRNEAEHGKTQTVPRP